MHPVVRTSWPLDSWDKRMHYMTSIFPKKDAKLKIEVGLLLTRGQSNQDVHYGSTASHALALAPRFRFDGCPG